MQFRSEDLELSPPWYPQCWGCDHDFNRGESSYREKLLRVFTGSKWNLGWEVDLCYECFRIVRDLV